MRDERLDRLADLLLNYSLQLKAGDMFEVNGGYAAKPLIKALLKRAHIIGAVPFFKLTGRTSSAAFSTALSAPNIRKNRNPPSTRSWNGKRNTGTIWSRT